MPRTVSHSWDLSPTEAVALQRQLAPRVILRPLPRRIRTVAGADVSYNRFSDVVYASIVVLALPGLSVVDRADAVDRFTFPYVPGLLSFRELPPLLDAWRRLSVRPDVLLLDGQGLAHPRRFGLACHAGLVLGLPTVGCAKTLFVGTYEDPGDDAGSSSPLVDRGEVVGAALRTRTRVAPVFVSPGHRADVASSVALALAVTGRFRIPEPTRLAHMRANDLRRAAGGADGQ